MFKKIAIATMVVLSLSAGAALALDGRAVIEARQAYFKGMGKEMKALNEGVRSNTDDVEALKRGAAALKAASPKMMSHFPRGSGPEVGVKTGAKPEIWTKGADFKSDAEAFMRAADKLDVAARTGQIATMKPAVAELGATCKACHDAFRNKDN
ncbi:c-type cytochrome [Caulobacter sp. LARHSG274]